MPARAAHKSTQRRTAILATLALGLGLLGLSFQMPAAANLPGSIFNTSDGNDTVQGSDPRDWSPSPAGFVSTTADLGSGAGDNSLSASEDDVAPTYSLGSIQPNKSDLTQIRVAHERVSGLVKFLPTDPTEKDFLYLAWDRVPDPSGNVSVDFELNKLAQPALPAPGSPWALHRSAGDMLITFELLNGGTTPQISLRRWITTGNGNLCESNPGTPCWNKQQVLSIGSSPAAEGSVNPGANIIFGEMAIDLGLANIFIPGQCTSFASVYAKSRSSGSGFNSQISDLVAPVTKSVTNCGKIIVTKAVAGPTITGDRFSFDFVVECKNPIGAVLDINGSAAGNTASFALGHGGTRDVVDIPIGSDCTVTETDPDAGTTVNAWTAAYIVNAGPSTSVSSGNAVATVNDVPLAGATVAFTNTRKTGTLSIAKATTGGDGTFRFAVDCTDDQFDRSAVDVRTTAGSGTSAPITAIPTETSCTVTETVPEGWASVGATSKTVVIVGQETASFSNRKLPSGIAIAKVASALTVHSGDKVTYTYTVTNIGENPLTSVVVVDDKCSPVVFGAGDIDGDTALDLTEAWTFTCTSTLTGTTTNIVTATGTDPHGATPTANATATVTVIKPAIAIDKTPSATSVAPGTTVVYTYTVTNPGDVALSGVTVSDDKCSPVTFVRGDVNVDKLLQVGETWIFQCNQVQTGSLDTLTNVGTATGVDALGLKVTGADTVSISVVAPSVIVRPAPEVVRPAPEVVTAPAVIVPPATLPRTGSDARGVLTLAGSLILLGLALTLTAGPISRMSRLKAT